MRYFETKPQKHSARLTTVIMLLLLLLMFVVGPGYMDPPLEYGVAVNFGTTDTGSGVVQPKKPIAAANTAVSEPVEEPVKAASPAPSSEPAASEEVLTAEDLETIAIKKAEAETAKRQAEADAKEKAEQERLKKEAELKAKKKQELDALMGGIGTNDGTNSAHQGI